MTQPCYQTMKKYEYFQVSGPQSPILTRMLGESEVHKDRLDRDAAGAATEVRVTAAIGLGFEGLDFVNLRDTSGSKPM